MAFAMMPADLMSEDAEGGEITLLRYEPAG